MKAKFGIIDEDTYNFDETGFMIGVIKSQLVVTGIHRLGKPKLVQQGNQTQRTMNQGISAVGPVITPSIIFAGHTHISTWYKDTLIPCDWVIRSARLAGPQMPTELCGCSTLTGI